MSPGMTSGPRSISPWWALLALPIAFGIGWGVANLPEGTGTPAEPAATRPESSQPSAAVQPPATETGEEGTGTAAPASGALSGWTTLSSAIDESQRNGKPILIDFNAEWCGPCRKMKEQVFDDPSLGRTVQAAVIPVSIVDRAREDGANPQEVTELQSRYDVDAFPTLVVFSPRSGQYRKTKGFGSAKQTVDWITSAAGEIR